MLWKNKKSQKKKKTDPKAREEGPDGKGLEDSPELQGFEQRIDEKIALLKILEEKAGKKIEALEKLLYASMYAESGPEGAGRRLNRMDEILALREKGLDALEIARILSVPAGEVELILGLNKK
ncbi:MAG: hypothetical protein M0Z48_12050 [Nitrospiraceae bacterium]|nr:hypothetical protein [Nitrospiraceae bacterium]